jgi:hypothetical protein
LFDAFFFTTRGRSGDQFKLDSQGEEKFGQGVMMLVSKDFDRSEKSNLCIKEFDNIPGNSSSYDCLATSNISL